MIDRRVSCVAVQPGRVVRGWPGIAAASPNPFMGVAIWVPFGHLGAGFSLAH